MAEIIRDGKPSRELYRDPDHGFIQMGHVHKQGHGNTPHDHGPCWVVYGAFSGVTDITKYKRTDDGSQPGKCTLEKDRLDRLSAGVVVPYVTRRYSFDPCGRGARRGFPFFELRFGQNRPQPLQPGKRHDHCRAGADR